MTSKTPGREDDDTQAADDTSAIDSKASVQVSELIPQIVEAVGGADNISGVNACFTRLRLSLKDTALVKDDSVFTKDLGASAIVHVGGGVQIVYGNKASVYKVEMREYLGME